MCFPFYIKCFYISMSCSVLCAILLLCILQLLTFLVTQVRQQMEEKAGRKFDEYKALKVVTQVVAGTNYFIKVWAHE